MHSQRSSAVQAAIAPVMQQTGRQGTLRAWHCIEKPQMQRAVACLLSEG